MGIWAKAGQTDLALHTFRDMAAVGCIPDSVACNALLNALLQGGMEDLVLRLFEIMKRQDRKAGPAMAMCPGQALEWPDDGHSSDHSLKLPPEGGVPQETVETPCKVPDSNTSLHDSHRAAAEPEVTEALSEPEVTEALIKIVQGALCKADPATYNTAMAAQVRACGGLPKALDMLKEMRSRGLAPDVITYNTLINACSVSAQVEEAERLFQDMQARGLKPNVVTYSTLITSHARAGAPLPFSDSSPQHQNQHRADSLDLITFLIAQSFEGTVTTGIALSKVA